MAKQWKTHREARKVHMSLRVTMAMFILGQIKQQAEALRLKAQSEELMDSEALWLTKEKAWSYLERGGDFGGSWNHAAAAEPPAHAHSSGQCPSSVPLLAPP